MPCNDGSPPLPRAYSADYYANGTPFQVYLPFLMRLFEPGTDTHRWHQASASPLYWQALRYMTRKLYTG